MNYNSYKINLTKEDYIQLRIDELMEDIDSEIKCENLYSMTDLVIRHKISNEVLKSMGCEKTYEEMCKYIPKRVESQSYYGRDCTTYGKCPTCGGHVQDGIGGTDSKCRVCGQVLIW